MPQVSIPLDLVDLRAVAGRKVSINVPVSYPDGASAAALSSAVSRARQRLQGLLLGATGRADPFHAGEGADLIAQGSLKAPWASVWGIRKAAYDAVQQGGLEYGVAFEGFGPEDVSVLDLDAPPEERTIAPAGAWYTDPSGESNADGTMNVGAVVSHGAETGLKNTGEAFGTVAKGLGGGVASSLGGFFDGLGTKGMIIFLAILVVVAVGILLYVFGPALLLGAVRGGA